MNEKLKWMFTKVTEVDHIKDLLDRCMENLSTLGDENRVGSIQATILRDKLITVENYTERYVPILMVKQLRHLMTPILDEEQKTVLETNTDKFLNTLATVIATDNG